MSACFPIRSVGFLEGGSVLWDQETKVSVPVLRGLGLVTVLC